MKRIFLILLAFSSFTFAQSGVRVGDSQPVTEVQTVPGVTLNLLGLVPNAIISFCGSPANAVPCTNKATTYTDATLGTPCPTSTQIVLAGTANCVGSTDPFGYWGVWVASGQYTFTVTVNGASSGPYPVTAGGSSGGGLPPAQFYVSGNTFNIGGLGALPSVTPAISINTIADGTISFAGPTDFENNPLVYEVPNSLSGTTQTLLAKIVNGQAMTTATNDVTGIAGCVWATPGSTGNAQIAFAGQIPCEADGAVTAGDYLVNSPIAAGEVEDSLLSPPQIPPTCPVGIALSTTGSAGIVNMLALPPCTSPGAFTGISNQLAIQALSAGVPSGSPIFFNLNPGGSGSVITIPNSAGADFMVLGSNSQIISNKTIGTLAGNIVKLGGQSITSVSGNTGKVVTTTGALTAGDCSKWDASGNAIDSGSPCGGSGGSPGGSTTQAQFNNVGAFGGIVNETYDGTKITIAQPSNGTTGLILKRATDTSPSGKIVEVQTAASADTAWIDFSGTALFNTLQLTNPFSPLYGGTGVASLTSHCVLIGQGTSAVHFACPVASTDVLTDNGAAADPTFQAPPSGANAVVTIPATNTANKVLPTSDSVALALQAKTGGVNDVFETYGQALMSAPSAPTLGSIAGGALGATTYFAVVTCVDNVGGETVVSAEPGQQSVSASNFLTVAGPTATTAPAGCQGYRPYITLGAGASGTETLQTITGSQCTLAVGTFVNACALGTTWTQTAATTAGAAVPGSTTAKIKTFWVDASGNANFSGTLYGFNDNVFFPGALSATYTAQTWTLQRNITITRFTAQAKTGPNGCSPNAKWTITDGTTPFVTAALTSSTLDSGVLSLNYTTGATLTVALSTAAAGCTVTTPADVNIVIEYGVH